MEMQKIGVFYGSSTGNCEIVAMEIQRILGKDVVHLFDIATCIPESVKSYQKLIFGVSTWGIGSLQEDWEDFLPVLTEENLRNKTVALYGLGDQQTYADSFVNGLGIMYDLLADKGCSVIGAWPAEDYQFDQSTAYRNNAFVGLVIDEDSQSDKTYERINKWMKQIKDAFFTKP